MAVVFIDAAALPEEKYTDKYDNIDLDEIISNERLLSNYFKCLMDEGKCTADGAELKKILPDAIKTKCAACSEKQKQGADKMVKHLYHNKPELWKKLEEKYDPEHVYRNLYKDEAKKYGYDV